MLKVGITGGIGSGKSVVCRVFKTLGIPVFNADESARYLMEHNADLIASIKKIFGADIYIDGKLNSNKLASIVFTDQIKLQELNGLVLPATIAYAHEWREKQTASYTIKEAAIFFESGTDKEMDVMIGVTAPLEIRINRAILRSGLSREEVLSRIAKQMDESEKMKLCDYVIVNDDTTAILPQILAIHEILIERSKH